MRPSCCLRRAFPSLPYLWDGIYKYLVWLVRHQCKVTLLLSVAISLQGNDGLCRLCWVLSALLPDAWKGHYGQWTSHFSHPRIITLPNFVFVTPVRHEEADLHEQWGTGSNWICAANSTLSCDKTWGGASVDALNEPYHLGQYSEKNAFSIVF